VLGQAAVLGPRGICPRQTGWALALEALSQATGWIRAWEAVQAAALCEHDDLAHKKGCVFKVSVTNTRGIFRNRRWHAAGGPPHLACAWAPS